MQFDLSRMKGPSQPDPPVLLAVEPIDLLVLIGQVELALEQPQNVGPKSKRARAMLKAFIERLVETGYAIPGQLVRKWQARGLMPEG